ncbi:hypothetical protein FJT64_014321 [Amphibalanus amphitrite]|uniref:Uncharacterized protein n=1 Tax=Amphibalanus amphitrite TaxID=1232801 RepID=A0A6A4V9Z1_AMPAM|nr:hypothetical protein FJT64_014321 [Amphibalanus amphitrite]
MGPSETLVWGYYVQVISGLAFIGFSALLSRLNAATAAESELLETLQQLEGGPRLTDGNRTRRPVATSDPSDSHTSRQETTTSDPSDSHTSRQETTRRHF